MTVKMTKEAPSSAQRYRNALYWLTEAERRVIQHALENYIKLGPDNSWPIRMARDLLKGTTR